MNYIISIIPIVLYLLGIKWMDALSFSNWKRLSACLIAGVLSCCVAYLITHSDMWQGGQIAAPLLEETLKALFVIFLACRGTKGFSIAFFAEAMVYGMAVGAGFAILENVLYVMYHDDITLLHCVIRGCGTALLHMGCTALLATLLVIFSRKRRPLLFYLQVVLAILFASAIHYLYNLFLIPPFIQLFVTIVAFLVLFMYLYYIEEKLIDKWLDTCISDDIQLLGAIREGQLEGTRAGEYLLSVRDSFRPEVFFDMLVFLQLYLELSIKAKSRIILRDAEMDTPIPPAEHREDMKRVEELRTLRSNIGMAGLSVLAPLIHVKNADKWVINELL